jgi:hypothetical protein
MSLPGGDDGKYLFEPVWSTLIKVYRVVFTAPLRQKG